MLTRFIWARSASSWRNLSRCSSARLRSVMSAMCADEDNALRVFAGQAMSLDLNVFDRTVSHQQAMLDNKLAPLRRGAVQDLTHPLPVMGWVRSMTSWRLGFVVGSHSNTRKLPSDQ